MRVYARGTENPNVRLLSDTLRKMMEEKGEESRAMIFVKSRATCKSLSRFLDTDLGNTGVKTAALYGKENREDEEGKDDRYIFFILISLECFDSCWIYQYIVSLDIRYARV